MGEKRPRYIKEKVDKGTKKQDHEKKKK